jgi:hypothetical protein
MRDFLRRVGLPSIIDATPATLRPSVQMTPAARLLLLVGRPLWAWRVELATVLLAVAVLRWLAGHLGIALAVLLVTVLASMLALVPEIRRPVRLLYRRAHVRRSWTLAVRHAGLANFNDRVPRVVGHRLTLAGDDLAVRVPAGKTVSEEITANLPLRPLQYGLAWSGWAGIVVSVVWFGAVVVCGMSTR